MESKDYHLQNSGVIFYISNYLVKFAVMVKRVFSAGGIVLREMDGEVKVMVSQHSKHHGWDFPKGHIEYGESAEQAALREVEEEVGIKGKIVEKMGETKYFYFEEGRKVFKTVTFFLMKYVGKGEATTAFEVSDKVWLPINEVEEKLTFKDTKKLWKEAEEKIGKLGL